MDVSHERQNIFVLVSVAYSKRTGVEVLFSLTISIDLFIAILFYLVELEQKEKQNYHSVFH